MVKNKYKNLAIAILVAFSVFLLGYFVVISPLKNKESKLIFLKNIAKKEIGLLEKLPGASSVLSNKITKLEELKGKERKIFSDLTIDNLARFLQENKLAVVTIEPESNDANKLAFVIHCTGSFQSLLLFFSTLLHSEHIIKLTRFDLAPLGFSFRLVEV